MKSYLDPLTRYLYEHVAGIGIYPGIFLKMRDCRHPITESLLDQKYQEAFTSETVVIAVTRIGTYRELERPADLMKVHEDIDNILSIPKSVWKGFNASQHNN